MQGDSRCRSITRVVSALRTGPVDREWRTGPYGPSGIERFRGLEAWFWLQLFRRVLVEGRMVANNWCANDQEVAALHLLAATEEGQASWWERREGGRSCSFGSIFVIVKK